MMETDTPVYVGIDYSINSPALCFWDEGRGWTFVAMVNNKFGEYAKYGRTRKEYKHYKALEYLSDQNDDLMFRCYEGGYHDKDFIVENQQMAVAAWGLAKLVATLIYKHCVTGDGEFRGVRIGLEGASFMSKERNSTDLNMFNGILRGVLANTFGKETLFVFPPSAVKKKAGKGNYNKDEMITAFVGAGPTASTLHRYVAGEYAKDKKNCKPLDDLCDAYWVVETLKDHFTNNDNDQK